MSNGHDRRHSWDASDPRSKVPAEEEAFLRSLGWTEAGEDEDGESVTQSVPAHTGMLDTRRANQLVTVLSDDCTLEVVLYVFSMSVLARAKVSAFSARC